MSDLHSNYLQFREFNPYLESYRLVVKIKDEDFDLYNVHRIELQVVDSVNTTNFSFVDFQQSSEFELKLYERTPDKILDAESISLTLGSNKLNYPEEFLHVVKQLIMRTRIESIKL